MMRVSGIRVLVLAFLALGLMASVATGAAAEEPRYNLSSIQQGKSIAVPPVGEGRASIFFYNIDGNRITHLSLTVSQAPEGWEVRIEPPERQVRVDLDGQLIEVSENLHVEPSPVVEQEVTDLPEEAVSVAIPGRGYTVGKVAQVVVRAPESAKPGEKADVTVSAEASWLGQAGAAAIGQAREFDFTAEVVSPGAAPSETILGSAPSAGEVAAEGPGGEQQSGVMSMLDRWLPTIIAAVIVIIGSVLIPTLVARSGATGSGPGAPGYGPRRMRTRRSRQGRRILILWGSGRLGW